MTWIAKCQHRYGIIADQNLLSNKFCCIYLKLPRIRGTGCFDRFHVYNPPKKMFKDILTNSNSNMSSDFPYFEKSICHNIWHGEVDHEHSHAAAKNCNTSPHLDQISSNF